MATKDITNQQLLQALTLTFDKRFDTLEGKFNTLEGRFDTLESRFDKLEGRFDTLEEMVTAIDKTLADTIDIMATGGDINELKKCIDGSLDACVADIELRLGRRIDNLLEPRNKRKLIAAKA